MVQDSDNSVTVEIESRLQDLFGDSDEFPVFGDDRGDSGNAFVGESEKNPPVDDFQKPMYGMENINESALKHMKSAILSIDWEINDETMEGLINEIQRLKKNYADDPTVSLLFQLLASLGKYIKTHKAKSHPNAINLLNSIYGSLETIILSKGMTDIEKKKAISGQVKKFKQLKEQIALAKAYSSKRRGVGFSPGESGHSTGEMESATELQEEIVAGRETEDKKDQGSLEALSLKKLKAVVLSVDWEITDAIMNDLLGQIEDLRITYKDDKTNMLLLQLLGSLGKYIKIHKADAHPDATKVLGSLYAGFEEVVLSKAMTEAARKKVLITRVKEFKQLKEQIALAKGGTAKKRDGPFPGSPKREQAEDTGLQEEVVPGRETFQAVDLSDKSSLSPLILEEVKEVIKAEFSALRAELKLWREAQ